MTARLVPDTADGRARAVDVLLAGGLVALPTDTVYGIAVRLGASRGIERLYEAKRRPLDKAITLLLADPEQAELVGHLGPAARVLAAAGWPGGLTLVLRQRPDSGLPAILTGGAQTIGVRVPDHPTPRALAEAVGPLPTTSANLAGAPTATTAAEILDGLGNDLDLILDGGPARGALASTVIDCSTERPRLLRAGAIPPAALAAVLDEADLEHDLPAD
jgi:L-threonylcarbamoyladenylate synthase